MIRVGMTNDRVWPMSRMKMPMSAAPKAMPRSRNTSRVIFHSPSPAHSAVTSGGRGLALSSSCRSRTASPGGTPAVSAKT